MSEIIKLSKTRINSYVCCPYKYYLRYGLNIRPQKKDLKLVLGLATHKVIENYLLQGICSDAGIQRCDPSYLVTEAWDEYTLENTDCKSAQDLAKAQEVCQTLVDLFIDQVSVTPYMIEHPFSVPVVNLESGEVLEGVLFTGRIDIVDERSFGPCIVEIKTKSKSGNFFDIRTSFELTGYAYSYRMEMGEDEAGISQVNLIKTKVPKVQQLDDVRDMDDFIRFFRTISAVAGGIQDERFYQNPGLHCGYCDYRPLCGKDFECAKKRFGEESVDLWQEKG